MKKIISFVVALSCYSTVVMSQNKEQTSDTLKIFVVNPNSKDEPIISFGYRTEEELREMKRKLNEKSNSDKNKGPNDIWDVAEHMPSFPGGGKAMELFINANRKYPKVAKEKGIQGRVKVSFIVEKDGNLSDVKVMWSPNPLLNNEAVRIIKSMPKWNPGMNKGQAVRVKYFVPIEFRLD